MEGWIFPSMTTKRPLWTLWRLDSTVFCKAPQEAEKPKWALPL